ncbi:dipeptide/oligopeptide/nickel ABC transporter ATP-binding protein [Halorhodospira abdelmalekii]|uniref:ABC transporter ATP-binding protein n=1 Tax=Halorhodospira abdelmalekii TaxID=421629 RepID=UPI001905D365|nr:ABC transporter ATP-binding protein [Halorhodospira abdelmalekii]MBK1734370.1 dipeptide/oligopeptide/nickel ABC transporter ATP-binding protein [Halorhodospira abdelmalekii]
MSAPALLEIADLRLSYRTESGAVRAVDGVNLELQRNEALVVLGESGCGKSSLAKTLLRLLPRNAVAPEGVVRLDGEDILGYSEERFRREVRWVRIALVMQAAMNALNPVIRVGEQVAEPLRIHRGWSRRRALERAAEAFSEVGIATDFLSRYPHELSGGMRQRAVIAMALVTEPDIVLLDEPTSALDVLTQAAIMNVLKRIKAERGMSFILITHDVATSSELADRVALMYAGQIVEEAAAERFFTAPAHPYSQMLMAAVPKLHQQQPPRPIPGRPPSLLDPPAGCRFAARCPQRIDRCSEAPPSTTLAPRHRSRCWLHAGGKR